MTNEGDVLWALTDNLNTVRDAVEYDDVADEASVVNHRTYEAFGKVASETNPSDPQAAPAKIAFGYTGKIFEEFTKLQQNHHRWYDATTGKWMSQDPVEDDKTNNDRYVGNNPVNKVDPEGLEPADALDWAAQLEPAESQWRLVETLPNGIMRVPGGGDFRDASARVRSAPLPDGTVIKVASIDGVYYTSNTTVQWKFPRSAAKTVNEVVEANFNEHEYGQAFFTKNVTLWTPETMVRMPNSQLSALGLLPGQKSLLPPEWTDEVLTAMSFVSPTFDPLQVHSDLAKGASPAEAARNQGSTIALNLSLSILSGVLAKKLIMAKALSKNADEIARLDDVAKRIDGATPEETIIVLRAEAAKTKSPQVRVALQEMLDEAETLVKKGSVPKAAPFSKIATATTKQLQKKFKHAADFGITGNPNKANLSKFRQAIQDHLNNPAVKEITGTYRGNPAIINVDPTTGLAVIRNPNGSFVSGWKLSPQQLQHVMSSGKLGGG